MVAFWIGFTIGVAWVPCWGAAKFLLSRLREWIRTKRGLPCPKCKNDGYTEDVDVDARSITQWPCDCSVGRQWSKQIRLLHQATD